MTHGGFTNHKAREHPCGSCGLRTSLNSFLIEAGRGGKSIPVLKISINGEFITTPRTSFQGLIITVVKDKHLISSPNLSISASNHLILLYTFVCSNGEPSIVKAPLSLLRIKDNMQHVFAEG